MTSNPLLWLSAADREIIAGLSRTEKAKQMGIGGAILTTSGMACASCALALHMTVKVALPVAVIIGVLWGLAILNLDRWLVASTPHTGHPLRSLPVLLPRLALALLVGVVISEPLVLRIFEDDITKEMKVMQRERESAFTKDLVEDPRFSTLSGLQQRHDQLIQLISSQLNEGDDLSNPAVKDLSDQYSQTDHAYQQAEQNVVCEYEGTCGSGKVGRGEAYQEKVAIQDRLKSERQVKQAELDQKKAEVRTSLITELQSKQAAARIELPNVDTEINRLHQLHDSIASGFSTANADGLLGYMQALDRLTHKPGSPLGKAVWVLRLFIIGIDSLPVLLKFFMTTGRRSVYDILLERKDQQHLDLLERRDQRERDLLERRDQRDQHERDLLERRDQHERDLLERRDQHERDLLEQTNQHERDLLERRNQHERDEADLELEADRAAMKADIQIRIDEAEIRRQFETELASDVTKKTVKAQGELFDALLAEWKARESYKIRQDPDSYLGGKAA